MAENVLVEQQGTPEQGAPGVLSEATIKDLLNTDKQVQEHSFYREEATKSYKALGSFVGEGADLDAVRSKTSLFDLYFFTMKWPNFSHNPQVREIFGEKLDKAEDVLGQAALERLNSENETEQEYAMYSLRDLENPATAPFYLLEHIRQAVGKGNFYLGYIRDYLSTFPPHKLEKLRESKIPGVAEIVNTVVSSDKENLEKPETLDLLKKEAVKTALHYFGNGEEQERMYIAKRWPNMLVSNAVKDEIMQILNNPSMTADATRTFFFNLAIDSRHSSSLELFMDYARKHNDEDVKSIFEHNDTALANFVIDRGFQEQDLTLFSGIYNLGEEDVRRGLELAVKEKNITNKDVLGIFSIPTLAELAKDGMPALLADLHKLGYEYKFNDLPGFKETNILLDIEVLKKILQNKDTHLPFLGQLRGFGYTLRSDDLDNFEEALRNKDGLLDSLAEIRKYKKDFKYRRAEDPYVSLAWNIDYEHHSSYEAYILLKNDAGNIPRRFSDPVFKKFMEKKIELTEAKRERFNKHFDMSVGEALRNPQLAWFYSSGFFLGKIANNPYTAEYVINFPHKFSKLFSLLNNGGPLDTNRMETIYSMFAEKEFSEKDIEEKAEKLLRTFGEETPEWKKLYWFTDKRLGKELAEAESQYPIKSIVGIPIENLVKKHPERLKTIVKDEDVLENLLNGKIDSIPFFALSDVYRKLVFRDYLRRAIEDSRDGEKKKEADARNRGFLEQELKLEEGDYFHGTGIDRLSDILHSGNLAAEAIGKNANKDAWPFHVDFSRVASYDSGHETERILMGSIASDHAFGSYVQGDREQSDSNLGIFLVIKRRNSNFEKGIDYLAGEDQKHGMFFAGVPSTATDAIVLKDANVALRTVVKEVVRNGFYIPVYDISGELLFTPQDYDSMKRE